MPTGIPGSGPHAKKRGPGRPRKTALAAAPPPQGIVIADQPTTMDTAMDAPSSNGYHLVPVTTLAEALDALDKITRVAQEYSILDQGTLVLTVPPGVQITAAYADGQWALVL